jgi:hypothetical protein
MRYTYRLASRRRRAAFNYSLLPAPAQYYEQQGIKLLGAGAWQSAVCPFHDDRNPSLRVHRQTGGYRCMVCGAHGGGILDFHIQRYGLCFIEAARDLGAWEDA